MKPVLYTPLRVEQVALRRAARSMRVVRTGMGPRRAAAAAAMLPDATSVLVAGVGGGLAPQVRPGDVVVAGELWDDGRRITVPSAPLLADALRLRGLTVHVGPIVSSQRIIRRIARTGTMTAAGGPLAVDMESVALAPVDATGCISKDVPFAVIRTIVDSADQPLWRLGTLRRGVRALRILRACLPALESWAAETRPATTHSPEGVI